MNKAADPYQAFDESAVPEHMIGLQEAQTLDGLFRARVKRTPEAEAYRFYSKRAETWRALSWHEVSMQVAVWQTALQKESLEVGDRVAIMMNNCEYWPIFDQAALGLGLVVVPLYANDRPDNLAHVLSDSGSKFLLIKDQEQADQLERVAEELQGISIKSVRRVKARRLSIEPIDDWLPAVGEAHTPDAHGPESLASIVYTSGTTGPPKGVMLSHKNMLWNAWAGLHSMMVYPDDQHLSFLPLSHTLERTVGYYLMMMVGAKVAYNRSIPDLATDLQIIKPTILVAVPRIFERVHGKIMANLEDESAIKQFLFNQAVKLGWQRFEISQGRANWSVGQIFAPLLDILVGAKVRSRLGGQLRIGIVGGAPLSAPVAEVFLALGVPLLQGYGLTETSPILSVNTHDRNDPTTVGALLRDVEIKNDPESGELIVRSPGVMQGYWNNQKATDEDIDQEGWLRTGDIASMQDGYLKITGRVKDIVVLANGEKIPPSDVEAAISLDPLIEQVMVIGEGRPFLSALLVLNKEEKGKRVERIKHREGDLNTVFKEDIGVRIRKALSEFPGYARIYKFAIVDDEWTIENELLTPTLKVKRARVLERYKDTIEGLYEGHV